MSRVRTAFDLEFLVGWVLLGGVALAMALLAGGLAWNWAGSGTFRLAYALRPANFYRFAAGEPGGALTGPLRPHLLVSLGLAVILLTPYVRVLASFLFFALVERNAKYAAFTLIVLAALSYSLFLR